MSFICFPWFNLISSFLHLCILLLFLFFILSIIPDSIGLYAFGLVICRHAPRTYNYRCIPQDISDRSYSNGISVLGVYRFFYFNAYGVQFSVFEWLTARARDHLD